jgi:glycosyltransferase involved in cell wall biosynthesis
VPRENVQALADALGLLLDDRTLRHQLGTRARQRIETNFSMKAAGSGLFEFFSGRGLR